MRKGEGDCDRNSDCAGNLRCYQRNGTTNIPGVKFKNYSENRRYRGWDVCYDPSDRDA